jgi:hypothetical protein
VNGRNLTDSQDEEGSHISTKNRAETSKKAPTVFEQISNWGALLLSKVKTGNGDAGNDTPQKSHGANFRSNMQKGKKCPASIFTWWKNYSQNQPHQEVFAGMSMARRLNYLNYTLGETKKSPGSKQANPDIQKLVKCLLECQVR